MRELSPSDVSPQRPPRPDPGHGGLLTSAALFAMLERARVARSSLILLTGPSGLSALLWLCRHGYERVGYLRPGAGPHEEPDALIVAHTCDAAAVGRLLAQGPRVREGGVLVFQSSLPQNPDGGVDPIHRLLASGGYVVEACHRGQRRELHVARRARRVALSLAA